MIIRGLPPLFSLPLTLCPSILHLLLPPYPLSSPPLPPRSPSSSPSILPLPLPPLSLHPPSLPLHLHLLFPSPPLSSPPPTLQKILMVCETKEISVITQCNKWSTSQCMSHHSCTPPAPPGTTCPTICRRPTGRDPREGCRHETECTDSSMLICTQGKTGFK